MCLKPDNVRIVRTVLDLLNQHNCFRFTKSKTILLFKSVVVFLKGIETASDTKYINSPRLQLF